MKKMTKIISLCLITLSLFLLVLTACRDNESSSSVTPSSIGCDTDTSEKTIVSLTDMNGRPKYDPGGDGTRISKLLQYELIDYKGHDVLFRVYLYTGLFIYDQFEDPETGRKEMVQRLEAVTGTTVTSAPYSSDIRPSLAQDLYEANVNECMLDKLWEAYPDIRIRFADPPRLEGYSKTLSDRLTHLISQMDANEGLKVSISSVLEGDLLSTSGITLGDPDYNKELTKKWPDDQEFTKDNIIRYLRAIRERNGIPVKPDHEVNASTGQDFLCAGFSATLTKDEILKLAEDPEVKLIVPYDEEYLMQKRMFYNLGA